MGQGAFRRGRFLVWLAIAAGIGLIVALATGAFSSKEGGQIGAPNTNTVTTAETGVLGGTTTFPKGDWGMYGLTYDQTRHSPLTQVTKDNVNKLGRVFELDFRQLDRTIPNGQQSFPLAINGVLYVTTSADHVFAIDGRDGKVLWHYKPTDIGIFKNFGATPNRGVAYCDGKLFLLTLDMRLNSIDPRSGKEIASVRISDTVPGATGQFGYTETMAPMCYRDVVLIGASGSDNGARGFVMAYHPDLTPAWPSPYWTVPPWGESWRSKTALAGGGTSWNPATIDSQTGTMYITTSHPSPIYFPQLRPGPDPRSNSVIALDVRTGRQLWWRQQLAADQWAYGTAQPVLLFDTKIDGRQRRVVAVSTKEGYWFEYDARTGEPIYQHVQLLNQIEHPSLQPGKSVIVFPGSIGGVNYSPSSYDPGTGYVVNSQAETSLELVQSDRISIQQHYLLGDVATGNSNGQFGTTPPGWHDYGSIAAINASTGQVAWKIVTPEPGRGGVTTTASGLSFVPGGDGVLRALDTKSGNVLWQFQTGFQLAAGPTVYEVDGKEYLAVTVGGTPTSSFGGTASRLDVFALNGSTKQSEAPVIRDQGIPLPGELLTSTQYFGLGKDSRTLTFQAIASLNKPAGEPSIDGTKAGKIVLTIPRDWTLNVTFRTHAAQGGDGLTVAPLSGSAPTPPATPAFAGGATAGDVRAGEIAYFSFRATTQGQYALVSTDPARAAAGEWVKLVVAAPTTIPSIRVAGQTFVVDVTRGR
jgi:PQQ-dependent dehydrogenase (methanol/ethanol family)